ncbi:MAG: phosphoribosyl 1,2-cyclic phosphate phosphodiesterase, partial [Thermoanaerobaculia bacterium]|nr:phosphoribosyl 1,2-cyclic phosphate phosphodiesterase [Thermoanaerobaculia bacterium]
MIAPAMRVTFLGSGTSTGVPVVGCSCRICTSSDPRNKRLRQSVKIESGGKHFIIDTTPDLRLQLLRDPIPRLDFILFTHSHSDHLMGLDDIRPFNFRQREPIQAYANANTAKAIR